MPHLTWLHKRCHATSIINGSSAGASYFVIRGINSTGAQLGTKTVYLYNVNTSYNGICVQDIDTASVPSSTCSNINELSISCNGVADSNGITCTKSAGDTILTISGLHNSGIIQLNVPVSLTPVDLGSAGNFAILSKSGISSTGTTSIVGNIGVSPIDSTAITGFGLIMDPSNQFSISSLLTGNAYAADYASPTPTVLITAIGDMETAYTDAAGRTLPDHTELGAGNIGGMTLAPGLYKWGTGVIIPTDVTISGNSTDVWIFQIDGTLDVSPATKVLLSGGAQADNIFWQVAGQATLRTTSVFEGTILDLTAVVLNTGATLNGRALAQTAVTLDGNSVSLPMMITPVLTTILLLPSSENISLEFTNQSNITRQLNVTSLDQFGLPMAAVISYASSNLSVATVNATSGLVTAVAPGAATINASSGAVSATSLITVGIADPTMTIISPANLTYSNFSITLNYSTIPLNYAVTNNDSCWYSLNGAPYTIVDACGNLTMHLSDGGYNILMGVNNSVNETVSQLVYFTVDTPSPAVTIISPTNTTYANNNIALTYTVTNNNSCWYSVDSGANQSLADCANTTVLGLTYGGHNVMVYANNSINEINSSSVYFTVDTAAPILFPIGSRIMTQGTWLNMTINSTSPGGFNLTFAIAGKPSTADFTDNLNGTAFFSWMPNLSNVGVNTTVNFTVTDGVKSTSEVISITVNAFQPPTTVPMNPGTTWVNADYNVTLNATGFNDTPIAYINYSLNNVSGQINGSFGNVLINTSGNNTLIFYAVDNVSNVEAPTTVYPLLDKIVPNITSFTLSLSSVVAGDIITGTCNATDNLDSNVTTNITGINTATIGTKTATCTATDAAGNSATAFANYTVNPASSGGSSGDSSGGTGGGSSGGGGGSLTNETESGGTTTSNASSSNVSTVQALITPPSSGVTLVEPTIQDFNASQGNLVAIITKYDDVPVFTGAETIPGSDVRVFEYLLIKLDRDNENVLTTRLQFEIPKSWFKDNGVDLISLSVFRFIDGKWVKQDIRYLGAGDTVQKFELRVDGSLSKYLAIAANSMVKPVVEATCLTQGCQTGQVCKAVGDKMVCVQNAEDEQTTIAGVIIPGFSMQAGSQLGLLQLLVVMVGLLIIAGFLLFLFLKKTKKYSWSSTSKQVQ